MPAADDDTDLDPGTSQTSDERTRGSRPPPLSIGRYRIDRVIGRGGMGEVLLAHDEQIGREVAIKRIQRGDPSERAIERFLREAQVQGRLEHPAIVPVHEVGRDAEGMPYFAMKKLAGATLAEILKQPDGERLSRQRLLRAFVDVCHAVELAHTRGVIHRDLKPQNIMLGDFGEVYVIDWGVAKVRGEADDGALEVSSPALTQAGAVIGTRGYMAPEQAGSTTDLDARADVYSLGRTLQDIVSADPEIPPELASLCDGATAFDREQRIATARALGDGVQSYLDGDRDLALRRSHARDHLERARTAHAAGDLRTAFREAGFALALDPTLEGAGTLISGMMLEPPRVLPPDLDAELNRADEALTHESAKRIMISNLSVFLFLPVLVLTTGTPWSDIGLIAGATALHTVATSWQAMQRIPSMWPSTITAFIFIALSARIFTPVTIAPSLAAVFVMLGAGPLGARRLRDVLIFVAVCCAAVIGPSMAEFAGLISPTMSIEPNRVTLFASGMDIQNVAIFPIYVLSLVGVSFAVTRAHARSERSLRRANQIQTWQLRQLFEPAPAR